MEPLVLLTPDQLRQLIADAVTDILIEVVESKPPAPPLLDRSRLAQALGCSTSLVGRLMREGCPAIRVGDVYRFDLAEVIAWLKSRDHKEASAKT